MPDKVRARLKKIQGQVDGIVRMYDDCRGCEEVVTQIAAARQALSAVGKELLKTEAVACVKEKQSGKLDTLLKQLFDIS